jgi:hypothetical protein
VSTCHAPAAEATQWLDDLDPDDPSVTVDDTADLRAVGLARQAGR